MLSYRVLLLKTKLKHPPVIFSSVSSSSSSYFIVVTVNNQKSIMWHELRKYKKHSKAWRELSLVNMYLKNLGHR